MTPVSTNTSSLSHLFSLKTINRVLPWIRPRWVLLSIGLLYGFLLIAQNRISYFPRQTVRYRLPGGGPLPYGLIREYVDHQPEKPYILIGDSVLYGYNVNPQESAGYIASRDLGVINLTNPSLSFLPEAALIQMMTEEGPPKKLIVEWNPKWFAYSSFGERFEPLKFTLSNTLHRRSTLWRTNLADHWSRLYPLLAWCDRIGLSELHYKIQYRWFNQSLLDLVLRLTPGTPSFSDRLQRLPFSEQEKIKETMIEAAPPKTPFSPYYKAEMGRITAMDLTAQLSSPDTQSLLDAILEARPNISVLMTPMDPSSLAQLPESDQHHYQDSVRYFRQWMVDHQIPVVLLELAPENFSDFDHFTKEGQQQALGGIKALCAQF